MENEYNSLDFCINILNDYLDSKDFDKYRIEPIVISELDIDNILKKENFNYDNILNKLEFYSKIDDKYVYFGKNYEVNISKYSGNRNLLSTKENIGLVFNYVLSELVTLDKKYNLESILLNLMNFSIKKKELKDKIINMKDFEDNDLLLVSIYERRHETITLADFIKKNKLDPEDFKIIFYKILFILDKLTNKYKNFRHNNLDLNSIRICLNKNSKKPNIDKFIIKLTNFENSYSDSIYKKTSKNISKENPYYDIHYFFSSFVNFCSNNNIKVDDRIMTFINQFIPEKYRQYENKNFKLDEEYYLSNETKFIFAKDLLKNIFFNDIIINNIEKNMNLSASPISVSESNLNNYKKKEKKINYDIDSLTESANSNSRMFAKNIKYKNKKTYSQSNNIKNTMIKGTRRLYVPTRNLKEGNMSSDVLSNVENDVRDNRRNKRRNNEDENLRRRDEVEESEVQDESSIESSERKISRSKKSKKSSKKSKKINSESSLTSLSSDILNSHSIQKSYNKPMSIPHTNMMSDGMMPRTNSNTMTQTPGLNNIGKLLGQAPGGLQPPSNLPMTSFPMEGNLPNIQNLPQMSGMQMPQMPTEIPQVMPSMMPQNMPNMMSSMMPEMMHQGMPGMMQQGMLPQMTPGVQSVNLNEGSIATGTQQNGLSFDKFVGQQGGGIKKPNGKVQLKLKKDFFF